METAIRLINGDRRETHGPVTKSFEDIAEAWTMALGFGVNSHMVGLLMADMKRSRMKQGKANQDDYVDLAAYIALAWGVFYVEQNLVKPAPPNPVPALPDHIKGFSPERRGVDQGITARLDRSGDDLGVRRKDDINA